MLSLLIHAQRLTIEPVSLQPMGRHECRPDILGRGSVRAKKRRAVPKCGLRLSVTFIPTSRRSTPC